MNDSIPQEFGVLATAPALALFVEKKVFFPSSLNVFIFFPLG
jgi:hypothetical protein